MPILSTSSLLLPAYVDVAGAHQESVTLANGALGQNVTYTVGANNYEVIISAFCVLNASAAAGQRGMVFIYRDADSNDLVEIPTTGPVDPAGAGAFQGLLGVSSLSGPFFGSNLAPLAAIALAPGFKFVFFLNNAQAGDQLTKLALVVQRYPTGTPASSLALRAAPALV